MEVEMSYKGHYERGKGKNTMSDNQLLQTKFSIQELRKKFNGRLISPEDAGYDRARTSLYGGFDPHPSAVIRPADAGEVAQVVNLARQTGLELAIRSGGHSLAGHSLTHGGIVLDLADMQTLHIDPDSRTAWAQSGLTAGKYTAAAAAHGLVTGFGDTSTVGLGGLTTGGGMGYLVRKFGLTIDQLLAAEVVTADGELVFTDEQSHPDLFWAIRGGGGNFGVVTRFKFRLHPLQKVYGGMLILPATADTITGMLDAAQSAGDDLSIIAVVMKAPPMPFLPAETHGKLVLMLNLVYAGNLEDAEAAVSPLRRLAAPLVDTLKPIPYTEMFMEEPESDFHPILASTTFFASGIDRATAQAVIAAIETSSAMMSIVQFRILGGAVSRVPADATAYAHRSENIMVYLMAMYANPSERPAHQAWVDALAKRFPKNGSGQYINFMGAASPEIVRQAYTTPVWNRLSRVKARYDPQNLFRRNYNIPPTFD